MAVDQNAVLQYIGARYVPKFYENPDTGDATWKSGVAYEAFTVVTYLQNSYTSKIPVPATVGDPASNGNYWVKTADWNAQLESLQQQISNLRNYINEQISDDNLTELIKDLPVNRWFTDNDSANMIEFNPASIAFKEYNKQAINFRHNLWFNKWLTSDNKDIEDAIHVISSSANTTHTYNREGITISSTDENATFIINNIFKNSAGNTCISFDVDVASNYDDYRIGIVLQALRFRLYYRNSAKQIFYESQESSYTPTALNNQINFAGASKLNVLVFIGQHQSSISVYVSADNGGYQYINTLSTNMNLAGDVGIFCFLKTTSLSATIKNLKLGYSFNALSDCRYIHYDDTTPFICDNKAYFTADLSAENISFVGLFSHTLGNSDIELVGVIKCNNDPNSLAPDIMYDRKHKCFVGSFVQTINNVNGVAVGLSYVNNLSGVIEFSAVALPNVEDHTSFGNYLSDEDPTICKFNDKWYVAINRKNDSNYSSYYYDIFESESDTFDVNTFVFKCSCVGTSLTGGNFIVVNNHLYFAAGNGTTITIFDAITGTSIGNLNLTTANRIWANITAINVGNKTKFYITTFDRTVQSSSEYSYGNIVMYESTNDFAELCTNNTYGIR